MIDETTSQPLSPNDAVLREFVVWSYKRTLLVRRRDEADADIKRACVRFLFTWFVWPALLAVIAIPTGLLASTAEGGSKIFPVIVFSAGVLWFFKLLARLLEAKHAVEKVTQFNKQISQLDAESIPDKLPPLY